LTFDACHDTMARIYKEGGENMKRKLYAHTTLNLSEDDIQRKIELEKKQDKKVAYTTIYRVGLEALEKNGKLKA